MAGPGGFSKAFKSNGKYDSTRGASIGRNDNSVATAKDGSDFSSFLGPLPPFSGRQVRTFRRKNVFFFFVFFAYTEFFT